jgi:hypothetical protein
MRKNRFVKRNLGKDCDIKDIYDIKDIKDLYRNMERILQAILRTSK